MTSHKTWSLTKIVYITSSVKLIFNSEWVSLSFWSCIVSYERERVGWILLAMKMIVDVNRLMVKWFFDAWSALFRHAHLERAWSRQWWSRAGLLHCSLCATHSSTWACLVTETPKAKKSPESASATEEPEAWQGASMGGNWRKSTLSDAND